jgi:hypothetical protein
MVVSVLGRNNGITSGARLQWAALRRLGVEAELLDATPALRNPPFRARLHLSCRRAADRRTDPQRFAECHFGLPDRLWAWELPDPTHVWTWPLPSGRGRGSCLYDPCSLHQFLNPLPIRKPVLFAKPLKRRRNSNGCASVQRHHGACRPLALKWGIWFSADKTMFRRCVINAIDRDGGRRGSVGTRPRPPSTGQSLLRQVGVTSPGLRRSSGAQSRSP